MSTSKLVLLPGRLITCQCRKATNWSRSMIHQLSTTSKKTSPFSNSFSKSSTSEFCCFAQATCLSTDVTVTVTSRAVGGSDLMDQA